MAFSPWNSAVSFSKVVLGSRPLADVACGRDNNFNLIRMIAASAVLISHAYPLAIGGHAIEPLYPLLHVSLGTLAVITFFAISGFFISQSFDRKAGLWDFCAARVLRIYPGLMVVLLFTVLLIGPIFTNLSVASYFSSLETWWYVPANLTLKWLQYDLPGVFHDNPYGPPINGSLWSLFYEVACYGMVAVLGLVWFSQRCWRVIAFLVLYAVGYIVLELTGSRLMEHAVIANFHRLTLPFVLGMAFYHSRKLLPVNLALCALAGAVAVSAYGSFWFTDVFILFWSYTIFCVGYLRAPILRIYNHVGDYSYGIYIYAFPCEQISAAMWKNISPLGLIVTSYPITLLCAVLSWHFIEKRALSYRATMAAGLKNSLYSVLGKQRLPSLKAN